MPLYRIIQHDNATTILLWEINESYDELTSGINLKEKSAKRLEGMKSESHRRGFLSVRKLLEAIGKTDFDLHYDQTGKPYFEDGTHISISHSHTFSAIIVSDKTVGIDLELCREKAAIIAHKFLHETELTHVDEKASDYIEKLTVLWGIKEVIFKIRNEAGISFKDHIRAETFEMTDQKTTAYLEMNGASLAFEIHFFAVKNFILVYAFV